MVVSRSLAKLERGGRHVSRQARERSMWACRRRIRRRRGLVPNTGLITVIVTAHNVQDYLPEALRSVLQQSYTRLEVLVVDDSSTDGTGEIADRFAREDARVRVFHRDDRDVNAARNFALTQASGTYLAFLDGDDVLLSGAYEDMVTALELHGTDGVVGGYDRFARGRTRPASEWIVTAHRRYRGRTTLAEFPEVMVNVVPWSKLYRLDFWREHIGRFEVGGHRRDQAVSALLYSHARGLTVLDRTVVHWRFRADGTSMTQQLFDHDNLRDRFDRGRDAIAIYRAIAGDRLADIRFAQYLNHDVAEVADKLGAASDEFWADFRAGLTAFVAEASPDVWARVHPRLRTRYRLVLDGRRDLSADTSVLR